MSDAPLDLYIAGYDDPDAAKEDFDALKKAQRDGVVFIDGAVLISRDDDGTIHVKETGDHDVLKGSVIGVGAGLVVGLFAPPLLGALVVGGIIGGVTGKLVKHHQEKNIAEGRRGHDPARAPPASSPSSKRSGWTRSRSSSRRPSRRPARRPTRRPPRSSRRPSRPRRPVPEARAGDSAAPRSLPATL